MATKTTIKKPAPKKTHLQALNAKRKEKGKPALVGAGLKDMGPAKLAKMAQRMDRSAAAAKKKKK